MSKKSPGALADTPGKFKLSSGDYSENAGCMEDERTAVIADIIFFAEFLFADVAAFASIGFGFNKDLFYDLRFTDHNPSLAPIFEGDREQPSLHGL